MARKRNKNNLQLPLHVHPHNPPPLSDSWFHCSCYGFLIFLIALVLIFGFIVLYPLLPSLKELNYEEELSIISGKLRNERLLYPEDFGLSYTKMERKFKVLVYPDANLSIHYMSRRKYYGKYGSEGYFIKNLKESRFITTDPDKANLFFIPISTHEMHFKGSPDEKMAIEAQNYVKRLIHDYPYWNRSQGSDHFTVSCHDIGVMASKGFPYLNNAIRVVCSSRNDSVFHPYKDIVFPPQLPINRTNRLYHHVRGFWEDSQNSKIRLVMVDKPNSIFCVCLTRSRPNAVCITESILQGYVPVVREDDRDLPFKNILHWGKFSVMLTKKDVHNLEDLVKRIKAQNFAYLHYNLLKVQKNFEWNAPPVRLDAFHMVMFQLWVRYHHL
uniref:Exostosin GT47 domain-containing protein n=1 Tax=Fagus sylvatica TaxID=28930 RepID=A0A2N9J2F7_FAGSY